MLAEVLDVGQRDGAGVATCRLQQRTSVRLHRGCVRVCLGPVDALQVQVLLRAGVHVGDAALHSTQHGTCDKAWQAAKQSVSQPPGSQALPTQYHRHMQRKESKENVADKRTSCLRRERHNAGTQCGV